MFPPRLKAPLLVSIVFIIVALLTCLPYRGVADLKLLATWDDRLYILENPLLKNLGAHTLLDAFLTLHTGNWHPLTQLSHALDVALFGFDASAPHVENLIIHIFNSTLVFALAYYVVIFSARQPAGVGDKRHLPAITGGLIAAVLFGIHPQHVEAVAWIAERKELLSTFFSLLTILFYLHSHSAPSHRTRDRALCLLSFSMAVMSKPMAVTVPVLLLLADIFPLRRFSLRTAVSLVREKWLFFALSLAIGMITIFSQNKFGALVDDSLPFSGRILLALHNFGFYIYKAFAPFVLLPHYGRLEELSADWWRGVILMACATLLATHEASKGRTHWMVALLWYVIAVLPVSGLLLAGNQGSADRFAYFSTIPLYLIIGHAASRLLLSGPRRSVPTAAVVGLVIYGLSVLTAAQLKVWRSDRDVWDYVLLYDYTNPVAHSNLGVLDLSIGELGSATAHFENALKYQPGFGPARANLGLTKTVKCIFFSNECHPAEALELLSGEFPPHYWALGLAYYQQKEYPKAEALLKLALDEHPVSPYAIFGLAALHEDLQDPDGARPYIEQLRQRDDPLSRLLISRLPGEAQQAADGTAPLPADGK